MSVVLHVGLPKTGTTYLQALLADHRDQLREVGVLYPFVRTGAMFHGAVEIRGSHLKFGLDPALLEGTWQELCERAHGFDGTTVISHEVLAGATPEQVAAAMAPLAGLDVRVVVTARDLGRQATAHWQEEVKLGDTRSFADFEREQFRTDTGRDAGPDSGGVRPHFWHAQDFADTLARWSAGLPPERAHLVVCPAPGAPSSELWRRFAAAVGVDPEVVESDREPGNPSLGSAEIALVREVNLLIGDRLRGAERHRIVKRDWAEGELAARAGDRPRTPASLADVLGAATKQWLAEVGREGYVVHGPASNLAPAVGEPDGPTPDTPPPLRDDPCEIAEELIRRGTGGTPGHLRQWRRP